MGGCIVFAVCVLVSLSVAQAASEPRFRIERAGELKPIVVKISRAMRPAPVFELPPAFIQGESGLFFVSTGWSWLCSANQPVTVAVDIGPQDCRRFSASDRVDLSNGQARSPAAAAKLGQDWGRSYAGVFSALMLPRAWHGYNLFTVLHGENKNERIGSSLYANTVDVEINPADCASGNAGNGYEDCWAAYNAFISARVAKISPAAGTVGLSSSIDLGPILWPTMGYHQGGKKTSDGLRHPSAILQGNFVYVFYTDTSSSNEEGRRGGVHVARMALSTSDSSPIGAAIPYYDGGFSDTNPSLPTGFSKDHVRDFYDQPGGRASELWPKSWQVVRFSVARIKGTSEFVGVEEYVDGKEWGVRLRVSEDLLHWSDPVAIPEDHSSEGWGQGKLHYPVFSDMTGETQVDVDPNEFYLLGTNSSQLMRQQIRLELVQ